MKKTFLTLMLATCSFVMFAQTWKSLRYNSYQYGLEHNPLKGYATMWDVHTSDPENPSYIPYSIQGKLFKFNEILTGRDSITNQYIYNWALVDTFVHRQGRMGKHVYLQVNIDPVDTAKILDLPKFIMDALKIPDSITGDSNLVYPNKKTITPNWNHPVLYNAMLDFVEKFGNRYNNDPRVFLVSMGLYGMWGEWHIFPHEKKYPRLEMNKANRDTLANRFARFFPNKQILGRYPGSFSNPERFGYSDGLFFEHSIGQPFWYFQNVLNDGGVGENWKNRPIGGEISPDIQYKIFEQYPNATGSVFIPKKNKFYDIQRADSTLKKLHTTWLFANYLFENPASNNITTADVKNNAVRLSQFMGYNFYAQSYLLTVNAGIPKLELNIQNKGVAPIYENWDVEFAVIDANKNLISLKKQKWDLNQILPSNSVTTKSITSTISVVDGNYTVVLRVINPLEQYSTNAPPLRFANETQDMHRKGWLSIANVTITNGQIVQSLEAIVQSPYGGKNRTIPGNIEAEEYDNGGMTIAYLDDTLRFGNVNNIYRSYDKVDILRKSKASNNFAVGYSNNGEWLEYTVDVKESRFYKITLGYFSAANKRGGLKVTLDGTEIATISGMQNLSNWVTRATVALENIYIPQGKDKTLRLEFVNGAGFDLDNIRFEAQPFIVDGDYALKSVSGAYLKATGSSNPLNSSTTLAGDSTKWKFTHIGNDIYRIGSVQFNNNWMEIPFGYTSAGSTVATTWYTGYGDHLKWKVSLVNGKFMFVPLHSLGNALDAEIANPALVKIDTKDTANLDQLFELIAQGSNFKLVSKEEEEQKVSLQIVEVYPNPASDKINIYIPEAKTLHTTIELFDALGKSMRFIDNAEVTTQLDLSSISCDLIFFRIVNNQRSEIFKVIHEK
jgi:Domain of unknown function (DUF4832)/Carbohydrate binding module (family 6)/Secretion system C-terminal sorting domain